MIVYLDTEFEKGNIVKHRSYDDMKYVITGFLITSIKDNKAESYLIQCGNGEHIYFMHPEEIEKEIVKP